jgi:hypothetical protein
MQGRDLRIAPLMVLPVALPVMTIVVVTIVATGSAATMVTVMAAVMRRVLILCEYRSGSRRKHHKEESQGDLLHDP